MLCVWSLWRISSRRKVKAVPGRIKVAGKRRLRRSWQQRVPGFNLTFIPAASQKQYVTHITWTPERSSTVRFIGPDGRGQGSLILWPSWCNAPNSRRELSLKNLPFHFCGMSSFCKTYSTIKRMAKYLDSVEHVTGGEGLWKQVGTCQEH